jgi:hypothetical protein
MSSAAVSCSTEASLKTNAWSLQLGENNRATGRK